MSLQEILETLLSWSSVVVQPSIELLFFVLDRIAYWLGYL